MPNTIGQHAVATFTSPVNGTTPIDANSVRGNDNTLRSSYNNHDADPGVHLQSSALASRPAAGTAGRKWLSNDTGSYRLWYDDGTTWQELTYLSGGGGTISGSLLITGTLGVTGLITASGGVSGNVTGNLTGNASTATALATARTINGVSFDGTANITVTAAAGTLTGSTLASGVTASSLTSVGTLTSLAVSGNTILGSEVFRSVDNDFMRIAGGNPSSTGANVIVFGSTHASAPGRVAITAVGTGEIQFSAGGAQRAVINSSGNLGIGTASPLLKLQVKTQTDGNLAVANSLVAGGVRVQAFNDAGSASVPLEIDGSVLNFNISAVQRATLNASGNLGLGVTPSAWSGLGSALQFNRGSLVMGGAANVDTYFSSNAFWDGSGWKYIGTASATQYTQNAAGDHRWYTAASGTAGNAISFTQAMTLDASGNLGVGTASPTSGFRLDVQATIARQRIESTTGTNQAEQRFVNSGGTFYVSLDSSVGAGFGTAYAAAMWHTGSYPMLFGTNNTERARIKSTGQLRFVPLSADPSGAETGDVYYNSSTNKLRVYNGAWVDLH
jgi:hypothetical protein